MRILPRTDEDERLNAFPADPLDEISLGKDANGDDGHWFPVGPERGTCAIGAPRAGGKQGT
jgi:hypothetical protein